MSGLGFGGQFGGNYGGGGNNYSNQGNQSQMNYGSQQTPFSQPQTVSYESSCRTYVVLTFISLFYRKAMCCPLKSLLLYKNICLQYVYYSNDFALLCNNIVFIC